MLISSISSHFSGLASCLQQFSDSSCKSHQQSLACHWKKLDILVIVVRMHDLSSHVILPPWNPSLTSPLTPAGVGPRICSWAKGWREGKEPAEPQLDWTGCNPVISIGSLKYCLKSDESLKACSADDEVHSNTIHYCQEGEKKKSPVLTAYFFLSSCDYCLTLADSKVLICMVPAGLFDK